MREKFVIRTYRKVDLAMLYCPDRPVDVAMRTFLRWLHYHPTLMAELEGLGYYKWRREFLPCEVERIVGRLGEP